MCQLGRVIKEGAGTRVGWRWWDKKSERGPYWSVYYNARWSPNHRKRADGLPAQWNSVGFYAFRLKKDAMNWCKNRGRLQLGKVRVSGRLVHHALGWRAEYATMLGAPK
mgnify:CR=1 FL=1